MATEVERLAVLIEANTKSYERAMLRLQQQTERAMRSSAASVTRLDSALTKLGGVAANFLRGFAVGALTAGIAGIASLAKNAITSTAAIGDLADKTGIGIQQIQQIGHVAAIAGVGFDEFNSAMTFFTRQVGMAAEGQGKLLEMLNRYNISLTDVSGNQKTVYTLFLEFADAIRNASSEQERLALTMAGFGRANDDMVEALRQGSEAILEQGRTAKTVTDEGVKQAQRWEDAMNKLWDNTTTDVTNWALTTLDWLKKVSDDIDRMLFKQGHIGAGRQPPGPTPPPRRLPGMEAPTAVMTGTGFIPVLPREKPDIDAIKRSIEETERAQRALEQQTRLVANAFEQETDRMNDLLNEARRLSDEVEFFGEIGLDVFDRLAQGGAKLDDILKDILRSLLRASLQASILGQGPLANLFGTGATTGGAGGLLGRIFGTVATRQHGGQMSAGRAYMVGESGPEMVVPGRSAYVVPNRGGGGTQQVHIHTEPGMRAETRQSSTPQGPRLDVIIRGAIRQELPATLGPLLRAQYGVMPALRRRQGS